MTALDGNALRFIDSVSGKRVTQLGREIDALPAETVKDVMLYLCGWRPGFAERFLEYVGETPSRYGGLRNG